MVQEEAMNKKELLTRVGKKLIEKREKKNPSPDEDEKDSGIKNSSMDIPRKSGLQPDGSFIIDDSMEARTRPLTPEEEEDLKNNAPEIYRMCQEIKRKYDKRRKKKA